MGPLTLRMLSILSLALLATLTKANPLLLSNPHIPQLPDGCEDFTVGACNPEQDELIDMYPNIPEEALCQTVCGIQEGCNYFRYSKSSKECKLSTIGSSPAATSSPDQRHQRLMIVPRMRNHPAIPL